MGLKRRVPLLLAEMLVPRATKNKIAALKKPTNAETTCPTYARSFSRTLTARPSPGPTVTGFPSQQAYETATRTSATLT